LQEKETMKILKTITLILCLASILGCSKDSSTSEETSFASLPGTWEVTSYSYEGTTAYRAINTNESWNTSYVGDGWSLNFNFVFSEDSNDYIVSGDHNIDHYYIDEDGQEFYYVGNLERNELGTFIRNGTTSITFNEDGEFKSGTIQELSETTLKFNMSESSSETNSDNVLVSKVRIETYILNRIN
jgi:hypothetical protein